MVCPLWNDGILLFLLLEMFLVFQIDRGSLSVIFINIASLTRKSM